MEFQPDHQRLTNHWHTIAEIKNDIECVTDEFARLKRELEKEKRQREHVKKTHLEWEIYDRIAESIKHYVMNALDEMSQILCTCPGLTTCHYS